LRISKALSMSRFVSVLPRCCSASEGCRTPAYQEPGQLSLAVTESHISDHDLERYYLGKIAAEEELAVLEEHLLWCEYCVDRAEETQDYVDVIRVAAYDDAPDEGFLERRAYV